MEKITRNNVEAWMLDYQEGNLSDRQVKRLLAFLESHPELSIDSEFSDFPILEAPELQFTGKADLFRTDLIVPELSEIEIECVARMEGDMIPADEMAFDQSLENNVEKAALYDRFKETTLTPDTGIVYSQKANLQKKGRIISLNVYRLVSAAAILILALLVFSPREPIQEVLELAKDSSRQVIYLDKLSHPSRFEKIAQVNLVRSPATQEKAVLESPVNSLEALAPLGKLPVKMLKSFALVPDQSFAFNYAKIPDPETEEYQTLMAFTGEMIREKILGQDPALVKKTIFSFWELADASIDKVANFLALPVDLDRQYNEEGKVVSIDFNSRLVAFSAPINGGRNRQSQSGL